MISVNEINGLKTLAEIQASYLKNRPIYIITEGDLITWKNASDFFDIATINVGLKMHPERSAVLAAAQNKVMIDNVPRAAYGMQLIVISIPIVNEAGDAVGAFSIINPILHPVLAAFEKFALILAEMFPEGVLLYTTDLHKIVNRQASKNFDLPQIQIGSALDDNDIAIKTIKTRQPSFAEVDAGKYGVPVLAVSYPLFDDNNEIVATFGMTMPKKIAAQLRDMSKTLDDGLRGISAAIQQLAASATQIHENEQVLNTDIKGIINLSNEINNISVFIKEIADETNMLGLNAAIEAARAGDAGRGFGVVAEEIRKLSEQSKSTVPQIKELTDNIKKEVGIVIEKSNSSLGASQEQAAASEEITASIEEITSMTEELNTIAKQL